MEGMWYVRLEELQDAMREMLGAFSRKGSVCFLHQGVPMVHLVCLHPLPGSEESAQRLERSIRYLTIQDLLREAKEKP